MTFEQQWLEYDYNPFVLFNGDGKIISVNAEAQFLLGAVTPHELFELAKTYANVTFGFKTTFIELEFGRYKFFGLSVGYEDEQQIGIKLYQTPSFKMSVSKPEGKLTNIFTIIDLCIATNSIGSDREYIKKYDPTIPDIIINTNTLIKILNKVYACFAHNEVITTEVFYRVGEHIKFEDKKYSLFSIMISAPQMDQLESQKLKILAEETHFFVDIRKAITLNIPMITL